ncbi:MAG: hypothetical protein JW951_00560 [Lentisphaerae bacterium]|nr:hypothetical protein [Lentisphaerota bacterium]
MNYRNGPEIALLIIGILGLVKAVFGLASPELVKRFAAWWIAFARRVNTLLAGLCVVAGVVLWLIVLAGQPAAYWLVLLFGVALIGAAAVYARPERLEAWVRALLLDRKPYMIRILGGISLVVSVILIWIALRG